MIDLIIFDLDGVLIDTEEIHWVGLCNAVCAKTNISYNQLATIVAPDGSTTKSKLKKLQDEFDISDAILAEIDQLKQLHVLDQFKKIPENSFLKNMLCKLRGRVKHLAIGSNSRQENIDIIISALGIRDYFSSILSGDDVKNHKPSPEIFLKIINLHGYKPESTLILEDSPAGAAAAIASGAHLFRINSCNDVSLENIINEITKAENCSADGRTGL